VLATRPTGVPPRTARFRANLTNAVGTPVHSGVETGNPVRVRNCPAAVNRNERLTKTHWPPKGWEAEATRYPGHGNACKSEDLPSARPKNGADLNLRLRGEGC
jgi:hypothetical protein